jgi:hypothetical protein
VTAKRGARAPRGPKRKETPELETLVLSAVGAERAPRLIRWVREIAAHELAPKQPIVPASKRFDREQYTFLRAEIADLFSFVRAASDGIDEHISSHDNTTTIPLTRSSQKLDLMLRRLGALDARIVDHRPRQRGARGSPVLGARTLIARHLHDVWGVERKQAERTADAAVLEARMRRGTSRTLAAKSLAKRGHRDARTRDAKQKRRTIRTN